MREKILLPHKEDVRSLRLVMTNLDISEKYKYPFDDYLIENENDIFLFMSALHSAEAARPSHPTFIKKCTLELKTDNHTFLINLSASPKGFVYYDYNGIYYKSKLLLDLLSDLAESYDKTSP